MVEMTYEPEGLKKSSSDRRSSDALFARVRENLDNEAAEIMWGAPGTMLAAHALLEWTGEERWADAWRESAGAVWQRRDEDGLWVNRLYGNTYRGLGPAHGVVGNALALLQGNLLSAQRIFAADCLDARSSYPILDSWD